jgi:hypothetical protein
LNSSNCFSIKILFSIFLSSFVFIFFQKQTDALKKKQNQNCNVILFLLQSISLFLISLEFNSILASSLAFQFSVITRLVLVLGCGAPTGSITITITCYDSIDSLSLPMIMITEYYIKLKLTSTVTVYCNILELKLTVVYKIEKFKRLKSSKNQKGANSGYLYARYLDNT